MALGIAAAFFAVFVLNLLMGAFGASAFLGDVGELLIMLATSVAFVVAILKREADAKARTGE